MNTDNYQVVVKSKNDFNITDRFDGTPYCIPANGGVSIPLDAAIHIFGVPFVTEAGVGFDREVIFRHLQKRWGWNHTKVLEEARKKFEKLSFHVEALTIVSKNISDDDETLVAPREKPQNLYPKGRVFSPKKEVEEGLA